MANVFRPDTLTFDPEFLSIYEASGIGNPCAQSTIIVGEDGTQYYLAAQNAGTLVINTASDGAAAINLGVTQIVSDCNAKFGTDFLNNLPGSGGFGSTGFSAVAIPDTPYFLIVQGRAFAVAVGIVLLYYKINSSGAAELAAGYSGASDNLFATQFRPTASYLTSCAGAGLVVRNTSLSGSGDIAFRAPIALSWFGEGQSAVFIAPPINFMVSAVAIIESVSGGVQTSKEISLASTYGASILNVQNFRSDVFPNRSFCLPREDGLGAWLCQNFYLPTLEAYAAGSESIANTYLDANASTYVDGLMSGARLNLTFDSDRVFDFAPSLVSNEVAFHTRFKRQNGDAAIPFPDTNENFDGSDGTSLNNYYVQPTVLPYLETGGDDWFVFFPRIYRSADDRDKIGLRVFHWERDAEAATEIAFANGKLLDISTDLGFQPDAEFQFANANVHWNRTTGEITLLIRTSRIASFGMVAAKLGTFDAILACAPTLTTPIEDITLFIDEAFSRDYSLNFRSPDGEPNSYSAAGLPPGLSIASNGRVSGAISGAASEGQTYSVTITATNACGSTSDAFVITVGTTVEGTDNFLFLHSSA